MYRLSGYSYPDFVTEMAEKLTQKPNVTVELPQGAVTEPFMKILEFLYCGVFVDIISHEQLIEVIKLAELLNVRPLLKYIYSCLKQYQDIVVTASGKITPIYTIDNLSSYGTSSLMGTMTSDYSLSNSVPVEMSFMSDESSMSLSDQSYPDEDTYPVPLVERQDGTLIEYSERSTGTYQSMTASTDFELYELDIRGQESLVYTLRNENFKDVTYDFYRLTNREVLSPEDDDFENPDLMFKELLLNQPLLQSTYNVILVVEEKCFYAHKAILSARSLYFKTFFSAPFIEKDQKVVTIKTVPRKYFSAIYQYIVSGKTSMKKTCTYLLKLLIYSEYLMIIDLATL